MKNKNKSQISLFNLLLRDVKKKDEQELPSIPDWELKEKEEKFIRTTKSLRLFYNYTFVDGEVGKEEAMPVKNSEEEFEKLVKSLERWNLK